MNENERTDTFYDMVRLLFKQCYECNIILQRAIINAIRELVCLQFTDEAGMINPTIKMVEEYNKRGIHILIKKIVIKADSEIFNKTSEVNFEKFGIEYIIRYENGINPDIEVTINPGGEL